MPSRAKRSTCVRPPLSTPPGLGASRRRQGPAAWFAVEEGSLFLDGIDLVAQTSEGTPPAALFRLRDSSWQARDCTFTMAGPTAFTLVHATGTKHGAIALRQSYARGAQVTPLSLQSPSDVLVEGSLLVAGAQPLIHYQGVDKDPVTVRWCARR